MSKSAIYAVNTNAGTAIPAGGTYPITRVIRRYGCDITSDGVGISCNSKGYYKVDAVATLVATGAGVITASLYENGVAVPGASSSVTAAAGDTVALPIDAIVRVNCCGNPATLTIVVSGVGTSVNAEMSVFKL